MRCQSSGPSSAGIAAHSSRFWNQLVPSSRLRSRWSPPRRLTTTGCTVERHDERRCRRPGRCSTGRRGDRRQLRVGSGRRVGLRLGLLGEHHQVLHAERLHVRHALGRRRCRRSAARAPGSELCVLIAAAVRKWYGVVPEASKNRPSMLAMQPSVQCGSSISAIVVPYCRCRSLFSHSARPQPSSGRRRAPPSCRPAPGTRRTPAGPRSPEVVAGPAVG